MLRRAVQALDVTKEDDRTVLRSIAAVDGAVIVGRDGTVLDAACMIGEPAPAALKAAGHAAPRLFSGARSTASWNASINGLAIKVSEDGPITVLEGGVVIGRLA